MTVAIPEIDVRNDFCVLIDNHPVTVKPDFTLDSAVFSDLSPDLRSKIDEWIDTRLKTRAAPNYRRTSYYLKLICERELGVRMTENQFKDAMLAHGFKPATINARNWNLNVSEKSPVLKERRS